MKTVKSVVGCVLSISAVVAVASCASSKDPAPAPPTTTASDGGTVSREAGTPSKTPPESSSGGW